MANQRTSKSIAERIDTSYYKHRHPIRAYKRYTSWGLLVLTFLCLLVPTLLWDHRIFQAAPVSSSHRLFGDQCERCHTETWGPMKRLATLDGDQMSVSEKACRECHNTADHSPLEIVQDVPHCARCHREHRPTHSLVSVDDTFCTRCHADLKVNKGSLRVAAHIADFADHPEFSVLRLKSKDPTNLRFNHQVHLGPQGVLGPNRTLKKLECQTCHELDSERRYMLPLNFQRHCQECHSNELAFDPARLPDRRAPHGDATAALAAIRAEYAEHFASEAEAEAKAPPPPSDERFNPARPRPRPAPPPASAKQQNDLVTAARTRLFEGKGGCRYCHDVKPTATGYEVPGALPPERWMKMSTFRHNSHRLLTCASCHPAVASSQTSDVLLPSIDLCRQCHNPEMSVHRAVRSDCVACHEYHDHALDRKFDGPLTLEKLEPPNAAKTTTPPGPTTPPPAATAP